MVSGSRLLGYASRSGGSLNEDSGFGEAGRSRVVRRSSLVCKESYKGKSHQGFPPLTNLRTGTGASTQ